MDPVCVKEVVGIVVGDRKLDRHRICGGAIVRVALGVAERQRVSRSQMPVDLRIALIVLSKAARRSYEVVIDAKRVAGCVIGKRIRLGVAEEIARDRIRNRDLVIGVSLWLARRRIVWVS